MKNLTLLFITIILIQFNNFAADIEFIDVPRNLQFYGRDDNNKGLVPIVGIVNNKQYDSAKVKLYRNNTLFEYKSCKLEFLANSAKFDLSVYINSELAEYKVLIFLDNNLIKTCDSLVCGDVYLINGQSNSHPYGNIYYSNEYWRSFGKHTNTDVYNPADTNWGLANGWGWYNVDLGVGGWGIEIQRLITSNFQIPIFILNGGSGGSFIEHNLPISTDKMNLSTTYGRLLYRAVKAKLADKVKAIFWHQGESNTVYPSTTTSYPSNFDILYKSWKEDFVNLKKIYVFQIRQGCGGDGQSEMREYQRNFPQTYTDIYVMSTVGLDGHDGCHYTEAGYNQMASWIYRVVARDFYGSSDNENIDPPNVIRAYYLDQENTKIGVDFTGDILIPADYNGNSIKDYFYFDSEFGVVENIELANAKSIILKLKSAKKYQKLTYLSNMNYNNSSTIYQGPWIKNPRGVGALSFYNMDIKPAVVLSKQPLSQNFCDNNSNVNLELIAIGNINYIIWQKFDVFSKNWIDISNSNKQKLSFKINDYNLGGGKYRCKIFAIQNIQPDYLISDEVIIRNLTKISNISLIAENLKTNYCVDDTLKLTIAANGNLKKFYLQEVIGGNVTLIDSVDCDYQNIIDYFKILKPKDTGLYRVQGFGAEECGNFSIYSNTIYVNVNEGVEIKVKGVSTQICKGNQFDIGITSTGNVISYQWFKNDNIINSSINPTAKKPDLIINNASKSDSGSYFCLVIAKVCDIEEEFYSDKILVNINSDFEIIHQYADSNYAINENAEIKIATENMGNVTFEWYKNDVLLNDNEKYSNTQTNAILITNLDANDFKNYYYVITESNDCRDTSSIFYLKRAGTEVKITNQPKSLNFCEGKNADIQIDYESSNCDSLIFNWYLDDDLIVANEFVTLNKSNLKISSFSKSFLGIYKLEIIALPGNIKIYSEPITLNIDKLPIIINQSPKSIIVNQGYNFELSIEVSSNHSSTYQWYKDNKLLKEYQSNKITKEISELNDNGIYYCEVANNCGKIKSEEINLNIIPSNSISEIINNDISIYPNPSYNYIELSVPEFNKMVLANDKIEIFDMLGTKVINDELSIQSKHIHRTQKIDISSLNSGIYFIIIGKWTKVFVKCE